MQETSENKTYVAIDLKSFYASVECKERGLDPMKTNLVVADKSRTEKTICLAVTPSLKSYGIPGRARLYEVVQKVKGVNNYRKSKLKEKEFTGSSYLDERLKKDPYLKVDYIVATPRMNLYKKYSNDIYNIYLKYFSKDDIYVYSVDEVFIDVTHYLNTYKMTAKELTTKVIQDVYKTKGITATAGIGTNLYLCKIAMDIGAKHVKEDKNGVRICELDEMNYRRLLWNHRPLTDFWRVGKGYAKRLESKRIYTMGDIARTSIENEELLYRLFGVNAELLIDHAWGWESCTIKNIKEYRPTSNSISSGQVLKTPYSYEKAKLIIKGMTENLALDLVEKNLVTSQIVLTIVYDVDNLKNKNIIYKGEITEDRYGRKIPKQAHGTINLDHKTSSNRLLLNAVLELYKRIINKDLLIRRIYIVANNVVNEDSVRDEKAFEQINLFTDYNQKKIDEKKEENENKIQSTLLRIKEKYGNNAVIKATDLEEGSTTLERNMQVGGHKG